jgi:hypothetical protein
MVLSRPLDVKTVEMVEEGRELVSIEVDGEENP